MLEFCTNPISYCTIQLSLWALILIPDRTVRYDSNLDYGFYFRLQITVHRLEITVLNYDYNSQVRLQVLTLNANLKLDYASRHRFGTYPNFKLSTYNAVLDYDYNSQVRLQVLTLNANLKLD